MTNKEALQLQPGDFVRYRDPITSKFAGYPEGQSFPVARVEQKFDGVKIWWHHASWGREVYEWSKHLERAAPYTPPHVKALLEVYTQ